MVLVRSQDPNVGIEFQEEITWGTDPGSWDSAGVFLIPFRSEDIHYEDDVFPDSEEFGALGALLGIDKGRRIVRGSLVVEPAYDTIWMWRLFGQSWGAENLVTGQDVFETAELNVNTHIFSPGTGLPVGMSIRVHKSGPSDAGSIDTITGLIVTRMVWDQPEGDRATITYDFIGKAITTGAATGDPPVSLEATPKKFKSTDLSRTNSRLHFGGTALTELNITGFTLTLDRRVEASEAFLNDPTILDKPGIVGNRAITLDITGLLEQDYNAANKPWNEFVAAPQIESSAVIVYESGDLASGSTNYQFRFDLPAIVWTDVRNNLTRAGTQPFSASGRIIQGDIDNLTSGLNDHVGIPTGGVVDLRALCAVVNTDEPAVDMKFTNLNDAP